MNIKKFFTNSFTILILFSFEILNSQNLEIAPQRNPDLTFFETYKRFDGRHFTLHSSLKTENSTQIKSGLIYSVLDKDIFLSNKKYRVTPWEGAICYFPEDIWNNSAEKLKFAKVDSNWRKVECIQGGNYEGVEFLFHCVEKSEINETLGIWYLYPLEMEKVKGVEYWWNGVSKEDDISNFKSYVIKYK